MAILDYDEVIVPLLDRDWRSMLRRIERSRGPNKARVISFPHAYYMRDKNAK